MPSFERSRQLRLVEENPPSYALVPKTAAYQMQPRDSLIKTDSTNGGFVVTLPSVVESAGGTYVIKNIAGTGPITVVDKGDAVIAVSQATILVTATAALVYMSDGERWYLVNSFA